MLEFIVLGIIPGTQTQLTLSWIAGIGSGLFGLFVLAGAVHRISTKKAVATLDEPNTATPQLA